MSSRLQGHKGNNYVNTKQSTHFSLVSTRQKNTDVLRVANGLKYLDVILYQKRGNAAKKLLFTTNQSIQGIDLFTCMVLFLEYGYK